jgi:hypothetical protein
MKKRCTIVSTPLILSNRSRSGCGFLLGLLLLGANNARAQRQGELSLSGGLTLSRLTATRQNLPDNFSVDAGFNTGAVVRLILPLSSRLGLGVEERVSGLTNSIRYGTRSGGLTAGLAYSTIHQLGLSLHLYDVWTPGPRWALDVALTGSYGWSSYKNNYYSGGSVWGNPPLSQFPTSTTPLVVLKQSYTAVGTPMAGVETILHYEWGRRNSLLLTLGYQRGLRTLVDLRTTRVAYLDDAGAVQEGGLTLSGRGSYATAQLGYGLRLGSAEARTRRNPTPRYSQDADEEASAE